MNEEDKDEDLIKEAIVEKDFEEDPPRIGDFIQWQTKFAFGIYQVLVAIAEKMGIDTKELLGEEHPEHEEEEEEVLE